MYNIYLMHRKAFSFFLVVLLLSIFSFREFLPHTLCIHPKEGVIHVEKEHLQSFCEHKEVHVEFLSKIKNLKFQLDLYKNLPSEQTIRIYLSPVFFKRTKSPPKEVLFKENFVRTVRLLI